MARTQPRQPDAPVASAPSPLEAGESQGSPLAPAARPGGRRRRASFARRRRILEAARRAFGEHGFAGATVGAIAREAGVSNGLLYQFFRNKEHLLEVVLEEVIRDWVRAMLPRSDESSLDALDGMFRRSVAFCRSHPLLSALLRDDEGVRLRRALPSSADRIQPYRDLVGEILQRGVERGELRADLDVPAVADIVCQLQAEYSARAYRGDPRYPDDPRIIEAAIGFVRRAVAVHG